MAQLRREIILSKLKTALIHSHPFGFASGVKVIGRVNVVARAEVVDWCGCQPTNVVAGERANARTARDLRVVQAEIEGTVSGLLRNPQPDFRRDTVMRNAVAKFVASSLHGDLLIVPNSVNVAVERANTKQLEVSQDEKIAGGNKNSLRAGKHKSTASVVEGDFGGQLRMSQRNKVSDEIVSGDYVMSDRVMKRNCCGKVNKLFAIISETVTAVERRNIQQINTLYIEKKSATTIIT